MRRTLPRLVRDTYADTMKAQRADTAAFEEAVNVLLEHLPRLGHDRARREVATMLANEPPADETGS